MDTAWGKHPRFFFRNDTFTFPSFKKHILGNSHVALCPTSWSPVLVKTKKQVSHFVPAFTLRNTELFNEEFHRGLTKYHGLQSHLSCEWRVVFSRRLVTIPAASHPQRGVCTNQTYLGYHGEQITATFLQKIELLAAELSGSLPAVTLLCVINITMTVKHEVTLPMVYFSW